MTLRCKFALGSYPTAQPVLKNDINVRLKTILHAGHVHCTPVIT